MEIYEVTKLGKYGKHIMLKKEDNFELGDKVAVAKSGEPLQTTNEPEPAKETKETTIKQQIDAAIKDHENDLH